MKLQSKIYLYNFLTVVFALLTVVSLGSLGDMALYTVFVNVALFGFLAHSCYNKENQLRRILKNRRRRKKPAGQGQDAAPKQEATEKPEQKQQKPKGDRHQSNKPRNDHPGSDKPRQDRPKQPKSEGKPAEAKQDAAPKAEGGSRPNNNHHRRRRRPRGPKPEGAPKTE